MNEKDQKSGILMGIATYLLWGSLAIYWKQLNGIDPVLIMFYRMIMSFVFVAIICVILYKKNEIIKPLLEKGVWYKVLICSIIIAFNWGLYIWSVSNNNIIECSMGYFMNPLLSVLFGVIFFHEKIDKYKIVAISFAAVGVLIMIFEYEKVPYIALSLALTFAFYGVLKKKLKIGAFLSLLYETAMLSPIAIIVVVYMEAAGKGVVGNATPFQYALVALSGVITAVPLLLFAASTNSIKLTTMGFLQYISPTLSLLIGVFIYKEPFGAAQIVPFLFIWIGLLVFSASTLFIRTKPSEPLE